MFDKIKKIMPWNKRPTMDEFIERSHKNHGSKYRGNISFESAWKCTLCGCTQYEGEDSPSSLCKRCGHQRYRHEERS